MERQPGRSSFPSGWATLFNPKGFFIFFDQTIPGGSIIYCRNFPQNLSNQDLYLIGPSSGLSGMKSSFIIVNQPSRLDVYRSESAS